MIISSNRVPGQLLPVGARYWENSGRPISALEALTGKPTKAISGFGDTVESAGLSLLGAIIRGAAGYYVGTKVVEDYKDRRTSGVIGALGAVFLGVPGLALPAFLYGAPAPVKKGK